MVALTSFGEAARGKVNSSALSGLGAPFLIPVSGEQGCMDNCGVTKRQSGPSRERQTAPGQVRPEHSFSWIPCIIPRSAAVKILILRIAFELRNISPLP